MDNVYYHYANAFGLIVIIQEVADKGTCVGMIDVMSRL